MLAIVVISFLLGSLFSLLLATSAWLYTTPRVKREKRDYIPPFISPTLPQTLSRGNGLSGGGENGESCNWFNFVTSFLFQELRDTSVVKDFILNKIHKEFNELMFTRKEGRMLEQLTVRNYDLGSSLPLFSNAFVQKNSSSEDLSQLEEVCVTVDVDYNGGFRIGIDADLILNRVAYVDIRIVRVKGRGMLQFTTKPHTHWSFSFSEEPEVVLEVESTVEGRSLPQLSSVMENQLRRFVKQRHTLPARKMRYKPFFTKPQPQTQLDELYIHDERLTVGRLTVEIGRTSQLIHSPSAVSTFCTVSITSLPWQPLLGIWRSKWAEFEFKIQRDERVLGFRYRMVMEWKERRSQFVMVSQVLPDSVAAKTGLRIGDIIMRLNNVKVRSVAQVEKSINKIKSGYVLLTVRRPPKHISQRMLQISSTHQTTPTANSGASSDVEEGGGVGVGVGAVGDGDSISLCGVGGERSLGSVGHDSDRTRGLAREVVEVERGEDGEERGWRQTEEVAVCRSIHWKKKKFNFNVGSQHHYLNVCVYDRVRTEDRRELLIGHVTLPLMDVALECLVSSSNIHTQKYVLLAPQLTRATTSRAAMQASKKGGRREGEKIKEKFQDVGKKFVGSVVLRFKHTSLQETMRAKTELEEEENEEEEEEMEEEEEEENVQEVDGESIEERKHQFQMKELSGVQRCRVCNKRIWSRRVKVCDICHIQCHKKCSHLLKPCRAAINFEQHESGGFQVYEEEGEHRGLQQQLSAEDGLREENQQDGDAGEEAKDRCATDDSEEKLWETADESELSEGQTSSDEELIVSNSDSENTEDDVSTNEIDDEMDVIAALQNTQNND